MKVVVSHNEARGGAVGGDGVTIEGELIVGDDHLGATGGHGGPGDADAVAEAVAVVLVHVAPGDDAPHRVGQADGDTEAGELAILDGEGVMPGDADAGGRTLGVGDRPNQLEMAEGNAGSGYLEEGEIIIVGPTDRRCRPPARRLVGLAGLDNAHIEQPAGADQDERTIDRHRAGEDVISRR